MSRLDKPKLRQLDFQPVDHQGERMWLLRDPWQLENRQLVFPQALAQMLLLCDGSRSPEEIAKELSEQLGEAVPLDVITQSILELDNACLLENDRFEYARRRAVEEFRSNPFRIPALAKHSYPATADELAPQLQAYNSGDATLDAESWFGRGIVSPHIDYERGGHVYAQVWNRAAASILRADLVLIFGTDHNGSPGSITLTRQAYATPFGVLPNSPKLIDRLADAIGPEAAFAEELNHRNEHSIELSAVWLHHIYNRANKQPSPMVPVLVGSFHHFLSNGAHPASDKKFNRFLDTLRQETEGRRVLVIGSVDLAHVGPAFGDGFVMDESRRVRLQMEDQNLMSAIRSGDAAEFFRQIWSVRDRNRICGFAPLYLLLRFLEGKSGIEVAYDQCPADQNDTSLVSICGLLLD